jgi:hypothetical protein
VRAAPDGSELCLQCGLCCDGTLFAFIKLEEDELEYVESLGLAVGERTQDGTFISPEPCPALQDGSCSLYVRGRPRTCIGYRCGLLQQYVDGQAGLADAFTVIQLVWSLARQLEVEMSLPLGAYNRVALRQYLEEHQPWERPAQHERFLVAFHRLDVLGRRYFGYEANPAETEASEARAKVAAEAAELTATS